MIHTFFNENKTRMFFSIIEDIGIPRISLFDKSSNLVKMDVTFSQETIWAIDFNENEYYDQFFAIYSSSGALYAISKPPEPVKDVQGTDSFGRLPESPSDYNFELLDFPSMQEIRQGNSMFFLNAFGSSVGQYSYNIHIATSGNYSPSVVTKDEYNQLISSPSSAFEISGNSFLISDMGSHGTFALPFSDKQNVRTKYRDYRNIINLDFLQTYNLFYQEGVQDYLVGRYASPVMLAKLGKYTKSITTFSSPLHNKNSEYNSTDSKFSGYFFGYSSKYEDNDVKISYIRTPLTSLEKSTGRITTDPIKNILFPQDMKFEAIDERYSIRTVYRGTYKVEKEEILCM